MVDIHHEGLTDAPVGVSFAYLADYRNATNWMFGLSAFTPSGECDYGLGSVFDATFHIAPVKLHSRIEVTGWDDDALIEFESIKGFRNTSSWRFIDNGDGRTRIQVVFSYELPGGIAGKVMGRAFEPIVALSVRHSDEALRKHIEAAHREQQH